MNKFKAFCRRIVKHKLDLSNSVILSNNCIAGFLYHDYSQRFLSPTINLQIEAVDFIKMCNDLRTYMKEPLIEYVHPDNDALFEAWHTSSFPIGKIMDVKIYFQHYYSFEEAQLKWQQRSKRMLDSIEEGAEINIILIRKNFIKQEYEKFEALPFENKIYIYSESSKTSHFNEETLPDVYVLKIPEEKQWFDYSIPPFWKYYDQFNFKRWLK